MDREAAYAVLTQINKLISRANPHNAEEVIAQIKSLISGGTSKRKSSKGETRQETGGFDRSED